MIKLKHLLIETLDKLDLSKSQSGIAFTTSADMIKFNDPYEYKFENGLWYTRKWKDGDKKWIDMKEVLSFADWQKSVDIILNKVYRVKTSDVLKNPDLLKTTDEPSNKETPIDKKRKKDIEDKKVVDKKPDSGITRDKLGYITSNKASVYGKSFTLARNKSVMLYPEIRINYVDRKTGKIEPGFYLGVIPSITPDEAYLYTIGSIKTVTMPVERGMSGTPDPFNGRKFTYLYVTSGNDKFKGWIQSNLVKIDS